MKRGWMIVLLLSVGLNIGLGVDLLRDGGPTPRPPRELEPAPGPGPERPDPDGVERFMRHRLDRMTRELGLDEDQQRALWTLHREAGPEVFERRRELMQARQRLHDAYADPDTGVGTVHAAMRHMSAAQSSLDSTVVEVMLRERAILDPQQRQHYHSLFPFGREGGPRRLAPERRHAPHHGRQRVE